MKDSTKEGVHAKYQKEEKEFVTTEKERKFWEMNLLGTSSAKSLLYTVHFYNGKMFGLRGLEIIEILGQMILSWGLILLSFKQILVHISWRSL